MFGSEQHFIDTFGQPRAAVLLGALKAADARAREIAAQDRLVEARTQPTLTFDLAVGHLDNFDQIEGVRRAYSQQQHLWVIDETYAIRVKKLTDGYKTSNQPSGQQSRIAAYLPLEGMAPLIYVAAGARYSPITGLPVEWVAVKHHPGPHRRQVVDWVVDLQKLAAGDTTATTIELPLADQSQQPAQVRRRRPTAGKDAAES